MQCKTTKPKLLEFFNLKNHRKERIFVFKKICAGIYKTITTFWANTGPLQDHFQKTLYTEKRSVYKTGWQHW